MLAMGFAVEATYKGSYPNTSGFPKRNVLWSRGGLMERRRYPKCPRCGPGGRGVCYSADVCCTSSACVINDPLLALPCRAESLHSHACQVPGKRCGAVTQGRCAMRGFCCGADGCRRDESCSNDATTDQFGTSVDMLEYSVSRSRSKPRTEEQIGGCLPGLAIVACSSAHVLLWHACRHIMMYHHLAAIIAVACSVIKWYSIPQLDDRLASQAIYGVKYDDGSALPPVFAHRGGGLDAPENTLAAFREAKKNGAAGIVFELSFTWDNVAVIFHDERLERTTDGVGRLEDARFDDLRRLDAAYRHRFARLFERQRLLTLEEGVDECLRLGMRFIVNVTTYDPRVVDVVDQLFRDRPELYLQALVSSLYFDVVYELRRRNPRIVTALAWRPRFLAYEDSNSTLPRFESNAAQLVAIIADWLYEKALHVGFLPYITGVSAVLINTDVLSADYVRAWRSRGVHVIAWTPNHPLQKNFLLNSLRVPIITDTLRHR
ncbi:hypothetical protein HPB50_018550 [Hyalomma asiaticum]|uniref:Uncharacterized protein n=1 Tax=Hyalomma asiaticum TaxID=266040 RepID=A0ACB7TKF8_HYAAI|nr:hypothetical protein HPB50_018550 [Hyalomma asiaticum]